MAVETKVMKCIKCGKGCKLTVTLEDGEVSKVTGNKCSRGPKYARKKLNSSKKEKTTNEKTTKEKPSKKKKKLLKKKEKLIKKLKSIIEKLKKYLS